jgi:hypothetical protein
MSRDEVLHQALEALAPLAALRSVPQLVAADEFHNKLFTFSFIGQKGFSSL